MEDLKESSASFTAMIRDKVSLLPPQQQEKAATSTSSSVYSTNTINSNNHGRNVKEDEQQEDDDDDDMKALLSKLKLEVQGGHVIGEAIILAKSGDRYGNIHAEAIDISAYVRLDSISHLFLTNVE